MAWLHATPRPSEGTKRAAAKTPADILSRLNRMKRDKITPSMPPNPAPHIIERLIEMGITEATGMGKSPIGWVAMQAWSSLTGVPLDPWEARLIRQMSVEYIDQAAKSESENCPPPWRGEVSEREKQIELARLRLVLG